MKDSSQGTAASAAVPIIEAELRAPEGVSAWAWLDKAGIEGVCGGLSPSLRAKFGIDATITILVAALAYNEGPPAPPPWASEWDGPLLRLGRFARADWYGELTRRLRSIASRSRLALRDAGIEAGLGRDWRFLANSGLPEKALALASGLGSLGRNDLILVGTGGLEGIRPLGPAVVLGLLLLPLDLGPALASSREFQGEKMKSPSLDDNGSLPRLRGEACASCEACVAACPTGALSFRSIEGRTTSVFTRELCLQHWSSVGGSLPRIVEAHWGERLYGCDACLEACPHFRIDPEARCERGFLGPGLPAAWFLASSDLAIRERLKGTTLARSWIDLEAFRRSARIAQVSRQSLRRI